MKAIDLLLELAIIILLMIYLLSRKAEAECQQEENRTEIRKEECLSQLIEAEGVSKQEDSIESVAYHKDGIRAAYPQFKQVDSIQNKDAVAAWNGIIYNDFNRILQIYSFRPFPETTPIPPERTPTLLEISYEIKLNDDKKISIVYIADYNNPYSAHPTSLLYTTNIDKGQNKRIRLRDYVTINQDFVRDFRTWTLKTDITEPELQQAIHDYMASISEDDLLLGLQAADQIGSDNPKGIFSYITPYNLGISIQVPNYIGDHIEFEKPLSELKNFIKSP
jgi:hypothetical protein